MVKLKKNCIYVKKEKESKQMYAMPAKNDAEVRPGLEF